MDFQAIEVDGTTYSSYEDLKQLSLLRLSGQLENGSVKFDNTARKKNL